MALEEPQRWEPQPGPQTAFARCPADIAIFGGAAGGGKSFALLYEAAKWTQVAGVRGYRAVLFRRTSPELMGGGGLWDESQAMFRAFGGRPRGFPLLDWTFEAQSGSTGDRHRIEFRHLLRDDTVHEHQGRQYALIGFDELTHFTERQFWYMVSRLRSTSGVRPYLRATCNPDPDSFVAKLIEWWIGPDGFPIPERSGVLRWFVRVDDALHWYGSEAEARASHEGSEPMSLTFIGSSLPDNAALLAKDPSYRARLMSMGRVDRARLLGDEKRGGNWHARQSAGLFFKRGEFRVASAPPSAIVRTVRAWDKASRKPSPKNPNPDWTRGVRVSLCADGELWIDDVVSLREGPVEVLGAMRETAALDGIGVEVALWQDTGGAGVTDLEVTQHALRGYSTVIVESFSADTTGMAKGGHRSSRAKRAFASAWAPEVEAGRVHVLEHDWTDDLLAECEAFPDGAHDDIVDAISLAAQVLMLGTSAPPDPGGKPRLTSELGRGRRARLWG